MTTPPKTSSKTGKSPRNLNASSGKKYDSSSSLGRVSLDTKQTKTTALSSLQRSASSLLGKNKPSILRTSRSVLYTRLAFLAVLVAAAIGLGYAANKIIADAEHQAAAERFDSIAERALDVAQLVIEEKKKATDSLALMVGSANPNADAWPNVYLEGYEEIATSLRFVTLSEIAFCPIVKPGGEEQESFERFAYDLFYNISDYPNTTGVSMFGRGIFDFGQSPTGESWPDRRYHITSNYTYHRSNHSVLVPFLQGDTGPHPVLMLNVHFEHNRAAAIDSVIECSDARKAAQDYDRECSSITDLMWSATQAKDVDPGPAGLMMIPIYPRKDKLTLTGFIVGKHIWHDLLKHGFESDVSGLHIVLRTSTASHTYVVENGDAIYVGGDDMHDPHASFSIVGTHINPGYFNNETIEYYMDIYSTDEFVEAYSTSNPATACIGAVLIIFGTTLLFVLYDYFVRREFHDKKQLLEAKRQFVRFVSHEVRTPLNTVCMGLTLLQHDFNSMLGLVTPTDGLLRVDTQRIHEWMQLSNQVFQNANAAVGVLSDLLHYDKIQMGTLTLELSLLPIWQVLERTVNEFQIAAQEKGVTLELVSANATDNTAVKFARVLGDNVKLTQVFRNLISNGLKFSREKGKLTVRVLEKALPPHKRKKETVLSGKEEVTVTRRGDIVIQVIDDGVGMTQEQVNTVFDDGTQFNANKFQAGGGSGLGMNIAKGVVSTHGGLLTADSKGLGYGSTFAVSLTLYESPIEEESTCSPTNFPNDVERDVTTRERDTDFVLPKFHILVVDDALSNRKLCMRLLERNGHTCEGASDGDEGLEMVKKSIEIGKPYDCILLDYEMPNMNGPEACREMRNLGCSSYIAGVTGNCMSEDVDHFRNCGANCVLPKPFRLETLEERWVEDDVTPYADGECQEAQGMIHVDSDGSLVEMGDELAISFQSNFSAQSWSSRHTMSSIISYISGTSC